MKQGEHSSIAGGSANSLKPLWKSIWRFLRKLGTNLPEESATPLLGIHPKDAPTNKDICSTMLIVGLFIISRNWKQSRCPSTEERTKNGGWEMAQG